jgi:hypothetical protein
MNHRLPGDRIHSFLARTVPEDWLRNFLAPTIADFQHEATSACKGSPRYWLACTQGYVALVRILVSPRLWWQSILTNGVVMRNVALVVVLGFCLVVGLAGIAVVSHTGPLTLPPVAGPATPPSLAGRIAALRQAEVAYWNASSTSETLAEAEAKLRTAQDRVWAVIYPGMTHEEVVAQLNAELERSFRDFQATHKLRSQRLN